MTVQQIADALRRARDYSGEPLEVVLVTRAVACPRCGRDRLDSFRAAESAEFCARRCRACGCAFRVVVATTADVVEAVTTAAGLAPRAPLPPAPAAAAIAGAAADPEDPPLTPSQRLADAREIEGAAVLTAEDRTDAARMLQGWRVRLASVRTRKLLDDEIDPRPEDLALLARAVLGGWG